MELWITYVILLQLINIVVGINFSLNFSNVVDVDVLPSSLGNAYNSINGSKFLENSVTLRIVDSNIPVLQFFPCFDNPLHHLVITNSNIRSIEENVFEDVNQHLLSLDLSHNDIENVSFMKNLLYLLVLDISYNNFKTINSLQWQYKNNLKILNLSHCKIDYLSDDSFVNLVKLTTIDLSYNFLTTINSAFSKLSRLNYANLNNNELNSISVSDFYVQNQNCPLKFIDLTNNKISIIKFEKLNRCKLLAGSNNVKSISFDFLSNLDTLDLSKSGLTKIELTTLHNVQISSTLNLSNNKLKIFQFDGKIFTSEFSIFNMTNTQIGNFEIQAFGHLKLKELVFKQNKVKTLKKYLFYNSNIAFMDLSDSTIELIEPKAFQSVINFNLTNNKLSSFNSNIIIDVTSLKVLDLSYNPIRVIHKTDFQFPNLQYLNLSHCFIDSIAEQSFKFLPHLIFLDLTRNNIKNISNVFKKMSRYLDKIDLSYNPITVLESYVFSNIPVKELILMGLDSLKIEKNAFNGLDNLESLVFDKTKTIKIEQNSFNGLEKLKCLNLSNKRIVELPKSFLGNTKQLEYLDLRRNSINFIYKESFSHRCKIKHLNMLYTNTFLPDNMFIKLSSLETLNISLPNIAIKNNTFYGLYNLKKMYFFGTTLDIMSNAFHGLDNLISLPSRQLFKGIDMIKNHTFNGLKKLVYLDLSYLNISHIEDYAFSGLDNLNTLYLNNNKINSLVKFAFLGLDKLEHLNLAYNNITGKRSTFPIGIFQNLQHLITLNLKHNNIKQFHFGEFSNLINLKYLDISYNQISSLENHLLFSLKNLEYLGMNANKVKTIDYVTLASFLPNLKSIGIGENQWKCEQLASMLNYFRGKNIDYLSNDLLNFDRENIDGVTCIYVCDYLYCNNEEDVTLLN